MIDKNVLMGFVVLLILSLFVGWKYGTGKGIGLFFGIFVAYAIVLTAIKSKKQ